MKVIEIDSVEDLAVLFATVTLDMTDAFKTAIEHAIENKNKSADVFEIHLGEQGTVYEVSVPRTAWVETLNNCLANYVKLDHCDGQIDTYMLLKKLQDEQVS